MSKVFSLLLIFLVALLLFASMANAETLKANYPVCVTEDLTKQVFMASYQKDVEALAWLSQNGCVVSTGGLHVTVIQRDGLGAYSHVRIYGRGQAVEAWTYSDAVSN